MSIFSFIGVLKLPSPRLFTGLLHSTTMVRNAKTLGARNKYALVFWFPHYHAAVEASPIIYNHSNFSYTEIPILAFNSE